MLMHVYGREWWFDVVNYGSNYGAGDPDAGLGEAWDTMGVDGEHARWPRLSAATIQ